MTFPDFLAEYLGVGNSWKPCRWKATPIRQRHTGITVRSHISMRRLSTLCSRPMRRLVISRLVQETQRNLHATQSQAPASPHRLSPLIPNRGLRSMKSAILPFAKGWKIAILACLINSSRATFCFSMDLIELLPIPM